MPKYKLIYFGARGRAELARYLFALGGVEYEDVRLDKDTWPPFKPKTPSGQLPVLDVDGKLFSQSIPIAIYLATEFGFYGSNALENLAILEVVGIVGDLREQMVTAFFEKDDAKKGELMKKLKEETVPKFLKILENNLSKTSDEFFVAKKLTLADVVAFDLLSGLVKETPNLLDSTPKLKANYGKVQNNDRIKKWIAKRPETQF